MKRCAFFLITSFCLAISGASFAFANDLYNTTGNASYYGEELQGNVTASGEVFNMNDFTAAHRTLPFNTLVRVTNLVNGNSVVVRINDRGPFVAGREIDLSKAAAASLGMLESGLVPVALHVLSLPDTTIGQGVQEEAFVPRAQEATVQTPPVSPPTAPVRYDIQLGAYSEKKNAEAMAARLSNAGFTNIAYQTEGSITRVVLRDLSASEVGTMTDRLKQYGFSEYIVKRRTLERVPQNTDTNTFEK